MKNSNNSRKYHSQTSWPLHTKTNSPQFQLLYLPYLLEDSRRRRSNNCTSLYLQFATYNSKGNFQNYIQKDGKNSRIFPRTFSHTSITGSTHPRCVWYPPTVNATKTPPARGKRAMATRSCASSAGNALRGPV